MGVIGFRFVFDDFDDSMIFFLVDGRIFFFFFIFFFSLLASGSNYLCTFVQGIRNETVKTWRILLEQETRTRGGNRKGESTRTYIKT